MAVRFTGPIRHRERLSVNSDARGWFSNKPVGEAPNVIEYFNDFLVAQDYAATDWVVTETTAGATQAITADFVGGALTLTSEANDNDVVQLQSAEEWFKITVGKKAWFDIRLALLDATESDLFVGFATTDTSIIAGTTDSIGFRKSDDAATLVSITEDNTVETTNTVATLVSATQTRMSFYWDGVSRIYFYVDGSLKSTHSTNIEQTNKLALTITQQNGAVAILTTIIDYIYVALER